ncbi:energy transducer TonB [Polynucleobacter sp. AM-7D1]|uniref:energy transducer TonB n=1 Tax=Polynucleobacter sp. AM-7D1 TaxID=2689102 RepID=UPI001BFE552E|nr:energy transducer TonB [Polynucleobacter sp. AM-7D1]QWE28965.1 TonB C-terminal domain-containing protein [Polynucleobacter sp. AM-7D1]
MNSAQTFHSNFSRGRSTKNESTKRAFSFSLAAHLGLLAFLVIGINWNNSTPSGVEVELWDASQQVETPVVPEVKAEIKEEAADIAINKKPVEKEPPKKEMPKEVPKAIQPPPPPPKEKVKEPPKKEVPKPVQAPPPPKEKEKPKKVDPPQKVESKSPTETKANAAAEKVRADQLARLRAAAGAEGGSGGSSGSGVGAGGNAQPGWTDKVVKKVKPLIVFNPESISGNPAAVVKVNLAPDGAILSTDLVSSSGNAGWDRAVLLALNRAESLPKDDNGKIPQREVKLTFKPKD